NSNAREPTDCLKLACEPSATSIEDPSESSCSCGTPIEQSWLASSAIHSSSCVAALPFRAWKSSGWRVNSSWCVLELRCPRILLPRHAVLPLSAADWLD